MCSNGDNRKLAEHPKYLSRPPADQKFKGLRLDADRPPNPNGIQFTTIDEAADCFGRYLQQCRNIRYCEQAG
jgi:hypothetical protein